MADLFCVGAEVVEDADGDALVLHSFAIGIGACAEGDVFVLGYEAEQNVLGADVVVAQRSGLFLSQDDHVSGALGKSLKHILKVPTFGR